MWPGKLWRCVNIQLQLQVIKLHDLVEPAGTPWDNGTYPGGGGGGNVIQPWGGGM